MSKERFECFVDEWDEYNWYVKDNKNNEEFEYLEDVTKILNQQDQRISELEEQLKGCIRPKFKVGDKVYANTVDYWEKDKPVRSPTQEEIEEIVYFYKLKGYWLKDWKKEEIFATKEEAQAKLEEMR